MMRATVSEIEFNSQLIRVPSIAIVLSSSPSKACQPPLMSLLIDRPVSGPSAHVLIVGVGHYDGDDFEDIRGMSGTIKRLYDWWAVTGTARLPEGVTLGSVAVLLSADEPVVLEPELDGATPRLATTENVRSSFASWIARCAEGGFGFLYWCGHGAMPGTGIGSTLSLYCENRVNQDLSKGRRGEQDGIDWMHTVVGLGALAEGSKISCYIDCCRRVADEPAYMSAALTGFRLNGKRDPIYLQYSVPEHDAAYGFCHPIQDIDFAGGPIATNAVLDAFSHYGAHERLDADWFGGNLGSIRREARFRYRRIASWIDELKDRPVNAFPGVVPEWEDDTVIRFPAAKTMLDVRLACGTPTGGLVCDVQSEGNSVLALNRRDAHWEGTTNRGLHDIVLRRDETPPSSSLFSETIDLQSSRRLDVRLDGGEI